MIQAPLERIPVIKSVLASPVFYPDRSEFLRLADGIQSRTSLQSTQVLVVHWHRLFMTTD